MPQASVRWSLRLPWSTVRTLDALVALDAPGRIGDVCGRAISHLLAQDGQVVAALAVHVAALRAGQPSDRTQVCSWRIDPAIVARCDAWCASHPAVALSWLVDAAIRSYATVCADRQAPAVAGLANRRYRRLSPALVVVLDEDAHAA